MTTPLEEVATNHPFGAKGLPEFAMTHPRVLIIVGTRPEAIKLAPVHAQLRRRFGLLGSRILLTGQHPDAARLGLKAFGMEPDLILSTPERDGLGRRTAAMLDQISEVAFRTRPDQIVVHGGTNSAFAGALAGYYADVPVAHVEAGLRTHDISRPYPEEGNRRCCHVNVPEVAGSMIRA